MIDFDLDLGLDAMDIELDFNVSDFDIQNPERVGEPQENVRILKPRIDIKQVTQVTAFEHAEAFAKQISLEPHSRTFAWVSGSFIFGDIIEALVTERNVGIKKLHITSLSFSQENIDSLKNVMVEMGEEFEKLIIILSGYQYSHEKFNLIPYMYKELDDGTNRLQVAFGGWHTKIICIETFTGRKIVIHGSANLRSSNSIEQVMIEIDDEELYEFNVGIMEHIAKEFGTINYDVDRLGFTRIEGKRAWEVTQEGAGQEIKRKKPGEKRRYKKRKKV